MAARRVPPWEYEDSTNKRIWFACPDLSSGFFLSKHFRRFLKSSLGGLDEDSVTSRKRLCVWFLGTSRHWNPLLTMLELGGKCDYRVWGLPLFLRGNGSRCKIISVSSLELSDLNGGWPGKSTTVKCFLRSTMQRACVIVNILSHLL